MGVSVPTLQRLEAGDPAVGIGIVATALWLIQRDGELGSLAAPEHDLGAVELEVREAVELGRARAQASAEARLRAKKELRCAWTICISGFSVTRPPHVTSAP